MLFSLKKNIIYLFFNIVLIWNIFFNIISFGAAEDMQISFQTPATMVMSWLIDLHHDVFSILLFICTVVLYLILVIIYRYRAGNVKVRRNFYFTHNTGLEIIWTVVPIFVLSFIVLPSFALLYETEVAPEEHPFMKQLDSDSYYYYFRVIGRQWYWSYEANVNQRTAIISEIPLSVAKKLPQSKNVFSEPIIEQVSGLWKDLHLGPNDLSVLPDQFIVTFDSYMVQDASLVSGMPRLLAVDNFLFLPLDRPIQILVTSSDVLHSWAVPSFGIKMDAVPGRLNLVYCVPDFFGTFFGQCSELCGVNHGFMPIGIRVVNDLLVDFFYMDKASYDVGYSEPLNFNILFDFYSPLFSK